MTKLNELYENWKWGLFLDSGRSCQYFHNWREDFSINKFCQPIILSYSFSRLNIHTLDSDTYYAIKIFMFYRIESHILEYWHTLFDNVGIHKDTKESDYMWPIYLIHIFCNETHNTLLHLWIRIQVTLHIWHQILIDGMQYYIFII